MSINQGLANTGIVNYQRHIGNRVRLNDDINVATATSIDLLGPNGNMIGFVNKIDSFDHKRDVKRIRHLNSYDRGNVIELVPNVSTTSISVSGFYMFPDANGVTQDIVNRVTNEEAASVGMLDTSRFNFDMGIRVRHHNVAERGGVFWLFKCGMDSWNIGGIDLDGDNVLTQSVSIQVSYTGYESFVDFDGPSIIDPYANNFSYS